MGTFYRPIPTAGRLHLKIGYVGSANMDVGSAHLNLNPSPAVNLTQADVGTQVSVIFAGPPQITQWNQANSDHTKPDVNGPQTMPYTVDANGEQLPHTQWPGTMLVAKITSVDGPNDCWLDQVCASPIQPNAASATIYREVETDINSPLKVQWTLTTSSRGTLTATIYDPTSSLRLRAGMPVYLYDDVEGDYFGGAIDSVKARNIPGRVWGANPTYWDIQALSWSYLLDRRLVNNALPPYPPHLANPFPVPPILAGSAIPGGAFYGINQPGQFNYMTIGDIVNQLIFNYCDTEGLSTNLYDNEGPVIKYFQANPGRDTIAQALDNVAQAAFSATEGWLWWVDAWKKVYFVSTQVFYAPWMIDETSPLPEESDASILLSVSVEETREKLSNLVTIDSSQTVQGNTTETYQGDSGKHSYAMGRPLGGAPIIWAGTPYGRINWTVATKGAGLQVADWYWALGDNSIDQEVLTTLRANIDSSTNQIPVITPMRISRDDPYPDDIAGRKYIQIDNEYMRIRHGSTTTTWTVDRGATLRGQNPPADHHTMGTAIYPAALVKGGAGGETFNCTYPPIMKATFYSPAGPTSATDTAGQANADRIAAQSFIESGSGHWESQISLGYPFFDQTGELGPALANAFVADFGVMPRTFQAETYRPGLAIGQILTVHLKRPLIEDPVNATLGVNFLIDQLDFTTEQKRQKWTIHAINGALIGDWRLAFMGLSDQFAPLAGAGSTLSGTPGVSGAGNWNPGSGGAATSGEVAIPGDAMFPDGYTSFTIAREYTADASGTTSTAEIRCVGDLESDINGNPIPVLFKVRREYVGGCVGQEGVLDPAQPNLIYLGIHPGMPLVADMFKGRIMSLLANQYGDTSNVPIADFEIVSNDEFGRFWVTPNVYGAAPSIATGDVWLIRTGRVAGAVTANDAYATATTFTDPLFNNPYNNPDNLPGGAGLQPGAHVGNIALVIAGTGVHQAAQLITGNTIDTITVSPGWAVMPDATSCVVIVDSTPQVFTPPHPVRGSPITARIPVGNYLSMVVRVGAYLDPQQVQEGSMESVPFRELYLWGAQSTRVINQGNAADGLFAIDGTLLFDTYYLPLQPGLHLVGPIAAQDTSFNTDGVYTPPNGTVIQMEGERMMVTEGSGTTALTVVRDPANAVDHTDGALIYVPGELDFHLLPFADVPNQTFTFSKVTDDISYVKILPAVGTTDQLPDGEPFHILSDTSTANGTYILKIPAQ